MKQQLIFFVKAPVKGEVKSRLAAVIGHDEALRIYASVALLSLDALKGGEYGITVAFFPPDAQDAVSGWLGPEFSYAAQKGEDLGSRMENAFTEAFSKGAERVVLVGSDIPELGRRVVEEAFASLGSSSAVIAPTFDGGYCLVGFRRDSFLPPVFKLKKWGTDTVYEETAADFSRAGTDVTVLPALRDIDRAEDLRFFPKLLQKRKFSVIIPVLHEAENINSLLGHLRSLKGSERAEIIVVDSGPESDTLARIADPAIKKLVSGKGRATQMNRGAREALGDILIFLHADTYLPREAFLKIEETFESGRFEGGAFDLQLESAHPFIKFISWSAGLRSRMTRIPYGDQCIFLARHYFEKLGGYREISLMEDVELMARVRKLGGKIRILDEPARTSARKYLQDGPLYSALRNHALRIMYALGVQPDTLAKLYYRK